MNLCYSPTGSRDEHRAPLHGNRRFYRRDPGSRNARRQYRLRSDTGHRRDLQRQRDRDGGRQPDEQGSVHLTSSGCGNPSTLAVGTGFTFTNGSGGILDTDAGDGGTRSISGKVTSDGTTNVDEVESQYSAGTWNNAGPLNLATGVTFTDGDRHPDRDLHRRHGRLGGEQRHGPHRPTGIDGGNTYNQGNGTTSGEPVLLTTGNRVRALPSTTREPAFRPSRPRAPGRSTATSPQDRHWT